MTALKVIAFVLILAGAVINYAAGLIVDRFSLAKKVTVREAHEFDEENLEKYKRMKALSIVKLAGFITLFPGVILVFIAFK